MGMKKLVLLVLLVFSGPAFSSQLGLVVIQFPESKTVAALDEALAGVSLAELTNSNRTMTRISYLKGGYVLFSQTGPATSRIRSSTRLSDIRADVDGTLGSGKITVSITLSEGVAAGFRRFSRRIFQGCGELRTGQPHVVGLRQISEKSRQVSRGDVHLKETLYSTAVIAQIVE